MKSNELNLELIEQHLEGKLTGTALETFETQLQQDKDFADEVSIFQNLMRGIEAAGEADFIAKVGAWEAAAKAEQQTTEVAQPKKKGKVVKMSNRRRYLRYIAVAAVGLLLLIPASRLFFASTPDLVGNNFEPYPNTIVVRGDATVSTLSIGMGFYDQKQYKKAAEALGKHIEQKENQETPANELADVRFYLAISQYLSKDLTGAAANFQQVIEQSPTFREMSEWYLALTYLKANDTTKGKTQLELVAGNERHSKSEAAKALLEKLK